MCKFQAITADYGTNITNHVALRGIPALLNNQIAAQLNASLSAIIESTTRVIVIFHGYHFVIMEALYDFGVRTGLDSGTG